MKLNKTAIMILGPEATGTKITQEIMVKCFGCDGYIGRGGIKNPNENFISFKRSLPAAGVWLDPQNLFDDLQQHGFNDIRLIITTRNWGYIARSHDRQFAPRPREETFSMIKKAYEKIFSFLAKTPIPYLMSSYESLISNPETHIKSIGEVLNLEPKSYDVCIKNGNLKYDKSW